MVSALIFGASAAGRWYAPKLGVTRAPYTISMVLVPMFYFLSINLKEKRWSKAIATLKRTARLPVDRKMRAKWVRIKAHKQALYAVGTCDYSKNDLNQKSKYTCSWTKSWHQMKIQK